MTTTRSTNLLVALVVSALGAAGCNAILGNDDPELRSSDAGGAGGASSGAAGSSSADGGSSGAPGGGAGAGGDVGGMSGASGQGGAAGHAGHGGKAGGGGAGQGGSTAGNGGAPGGHAGAGGTGASAGDGGTAGTAGGAAGAGGGPTCPVLYVSSAANGDDSHDGCSTASPLKTVKTGIERAKSIGGDMALREIHVCGGIYDVSGTTLDFPVSLLGGWDCVAWKRASGYGYPSFKQDNVTRFVALTGAVTDTFTVTNGTSFPPITQQVLIDGFNFEGAVSGSVSNSTAIAALSINGAASPTVQNCQMLGGGTVNSAGGGTAGLVVTGTNTAPLITLDKIRGGSGGSTFGSAGSIGLQVRGAATPKIISNAILGGSGKSTTASGSIGVHLNQPGDMTGKGSLEANVIDGGQGTSTTGNIGLLVSSGNGVDVVANTISGGSQPATADVGGNITGVVTVTSQNVLIARNRIYGGESAVSRGHRGVFFSGGKGLILVNNEIHAGGVNGSSTTDATSAAVLLVSGANGTKIVHNTLIVPHSDVNWALVETIGANPGTALQNNLFLGTAHGALGVQITGTSPCNSNGTVTSLSSNVFVNVDIGLVNDGCGKVYTQISDLTAGMKMHLPTIDVGGNYVITGAASADTGAIVVAACAKGAPACASAVVDNWTQSDFGASGMLTAGGGLSLAPTAPCPVAKSALSDLGFAPLDLLGTPRTDPPSMGAFEDDGACCKIVGDGCSAATECCSGVCAATMCAPP